MSLDKIDYLFETDKVLDRDKDTKEDITKYKHKIVLYGGIT